MPVEKQSGADVFSGTINGDGTLTIEATKTAEDTTLARIIHMVEEARARRAPSEQWVELLPPLYARGNGAWLFVFVPHRSPSPSLGPSGSLAPLLF